MSSLEHLGRARGRPIASVVDPRLEARVELLRHVGVLAERLHLRPERLLLLGDGGVVLLQLARRRHAGRRRCPRCGSATSGSARSRREPGPRRARPRAACAGRPASGRACAGLSSSTERRSSSRLLAIGASPSPEAAHRPGRAVEQPVAHVGGRADLAVGEAVDVVDAPAVVVAVDVERPRGRRRTSATMASIRLAASGSMRDLALGLGRGRPS